MQQLRVSAVAMENWVGQPERSLARVEEWARRAADDGSELVVFPELSVTGYIAAPVAQRHAEGIPGPSTDRLRAIAARTGITICAGLVEASGGRYFNTQVLVRGDGVVGAQRKIHVPAHERPYWDGGDDIAVIDVGQARVGITICRDSFFSEMLGTLYQKGAEVILMPFCYPTVPRSRYLEDTIHGMSLRYHCWAYGFHGVVCNSAGDREANETQPSGVSFPGWAGVVGPWGQVLEFTRDDGNGEAMVSLTLTPESLADRRNHPNFIAGDLRPELYSSRPKLS